MLAGLFAPASAWAQGGSIVAWGANDYGQCSVPSPNANFVAVAGGYYHSLGLKADGSIVPWGRNDNGQCNLPGPNADFVAVAAAHYHSLGLKADGSIVAWGYNQFGQCNVPAPNSDFVAVAGGYGHSLGLKAEGSIVALGYNYYGQCNVPIPNADFVAVAAHSQNSLGLKAEGSIVAWGQNAYGECNVPAPNTDFVAIATGGRHSLGLKADGSIAAWGHNGYGQCDIPQPNTDFLAIAAGGLHSLGLKSDGSIVAWGDNRVWGQCNVPAPNLDFVAIAAGIIHNLGLRIPDNEPPVAAAGPDQSIHAGQIVDLDGSASYDDNTPSEQLEYAWTLTEKPMDSAAVIWSGVYPWTPSFLADVPGTYTVSLVVTDEGGLSSEPDTVVISSLNVAPNANAGPDAGAIVGYVVQLDGTQSLDPDLDPLTYAWSITGAPEGSTATLVGETTAMASFIPDLPGLYSVQLIVNDGFLASEPDEVVVSVITAEEFAENNTMEGLNTVAELAPESVTTKGNQTALGNFLTQAIVALQADDTEEAINKLSKALGRTDGCVLRGEPDGPGPGRDWITDCAEQQVVYWLLKDALDAVSP